MSYYPKLDDDDPLAPLIAAVKTCPAYSQRIHRELLRRFGRKSRHRMAEFLHWSRYLRERYRRPMYLHLLELANDVEFLRSLYRIELKPGIRAAAGVRKEEDKHERTEQNRRTGGPVEPAEAG
jgi:hypothetical protein